MQKAAQEQKKAEKEAKQAQDTLKETSDKIDESAKEMRREIIENQVTEEQIQEELGAAI